MTPSYRIGVVGLALGLAGILAGCEDNTKSTQTGYRGTGMVQLSYASQDEARAAANTVPEPQPAATPGGPKVSELPDQYKNVQVLGDLNEEEFNRTMAAITEWVAPEQGCEYCHNAEDLSSDEVYTKVVARRMIQMTRHVNADWKAHVAGTGVTCYTCHRGHPVPLNAWYQNPGPREANGMARTHTGQNHPMATVGVTSLPYDPFTTLFNDPNQIRVVSTSRLPPGSEKTIQQTEKTYGLMVHMSEGLGVNCTFCHNAQSFQNWNTSNAQRVTAWHGIRMVSDINASYIGPLASVFPANRKGPLGDPLKANCTTCHQGVNKPLLGVSMLKDYLAALGGEPASN